MKPGMYRIGLSAFAFWLYTLPAEPMDGVRVAQAVQNAPPARAPRAPAAGATMPALPVPSGEDTRARAASRTNSSQLPATPGQVQTEAPTPAQIPTRTEILNFENWAVTCNEFADGPRTRKCSALLHILQQNTNQTVFTWTVAVDDRKQLVSVMQTPTGVVIPPGVELRVGKFPPQKIPFASCDTGRCVATMNMDANLLREMTTSPTAEAVIQSAQGNTVQFNIQMKGFDRAYAALSR